MNIAINSKQFVCNLWLTTLPTHCWAVRHLFILKLSFIFSSIYNEMDSDQRWIYFMKFSYIVKPMIYCSCYFVRDWKKKLKNFLHFSVWIIHIFSLIPYSSYWHLEKLFNASPQLFVRLYNQDFRFSPNTINAITALIWTSF